MNIAITGATGFLGSSLVSALAGQGSHAIVGLSTRNCDLTDAAALRAFPHPRYDRIFHLAAWTRAGDFCLHHPGEQWIINQQINTNVLTWWRDHQPQAKLIAIGTSCAYDECLPLAEENYLSGEPIVSLYTYAMTKRMLYVGLRALRAQFGLRYLHVVPSTLYGPGYHEDGRQMHFIFDLIRKILVAKHGGDEVVLWGDGQQRRELVHVADFTRVLLTLADGVEGETVNIGAGSDRTIREFAASICAIVGYDAGRIRYDESRYTGARAKLLQVEKMRRLLPGAGSTPLDEGLRQTIGWMERETGLVARSVSTLDGTEDAHG
jgi:GDP-L-fucose synthase